MMARQLFVEFTSIALYTYRKIVPGYNVDIFLGMSERLFSWYAWQVRDTQLERGVLDFLYTMSACLDTIVMAHSKCVTNSLFYGADTYDKYSQYN